MLALAQWALQVRMGLQVGTPAQVEPLEQLTPAVPLRQQARQGQAAQQGTVRRAAQAMRLALRQALLPRGRAMRTRQRAPRRAQQKAPAHREAVRWSRASPLVWGHWQHSTIDVRRALRHPDPQLQPTEPLPKAKADRLPPLTQPQIVSDFHAIIPVP